MKGFLWSVGILLLILGLVIGNALAVGAKIRQTENEIAMIEAPTPGEEPSKTDLSRQKEAVAALRGRWERRLHLISLTVNHNDLMAVQEQLATLEGAADAGALGVAGSPLASRKTGRSGTGCAVLKAGIVRFCGTPAQKCMQPSLDPANRLCK